MSYFRCPECGGGPSRAYLVPLEDEVLPMWECDEGCTDEAGEPRAFTARQLEAVGRPREDKLGAWADADILDCLREDTCSRAPGGADPTGEAQEVYIDKSENDRRARMEQADSLRDYTRADVTIDPATCRTKQRLVKLPPDLMDKVRVAARRARKSVSDFVRELVGKRLLEGIDSNSSPVVS